MVRINSPLVGIGDLTSKYYRLQQVVAEGILTLDTYTERLNKCINEIEKKTKLAECQGIAKDLKFQNQSLLMNLSLIKILKKKRQHLLRRYLPASNLSSSPNKVVNIKMKLGLRRKNMDSMAKEVNIKLILKDYNFLMSNKKPINLKLELVDRNTGICKQVSLHIYLHFKGFEIV